MRKVYLDKLNLCPSRVSLIGFVSRWVINYLHHVIDHRQFSIVPGVYNFVQYLHLGAEKDCNVGTVDFDLVL